MSAHEKLGRYMRGDDAPSVSYSDEVWRTIATLIVESFAEQFGVRLSHEPLSGASVGEGLSLDVWSPARRGLDGAVRWRGIAGCDLGDEGRFAYASVSLFPYVLGKKVVTLAGHEFVEYRFEPSAAEPHWQAGVWGRGEHGEFSNFEADWPKTET